MKRINWISGIILLQLLTAQYGSLPTADDNAATRVGNWLKIGTSTRANSMGGAIVANASGVADLSYNPAGIALLEGSEIYFTKTNYLAGITHNMIAYGTKLSPADYFGFNLFFLNSGDMKVTNTYYPEGTGESFSVNTIAFRTAYARSISEAVKLGFDIDYIREDIYTTTMQTLALDLGLLYRSPLFGTVIGMSVSNLGPAVEFHGEGLENVVPDTLIADERLARITEEFNLPLVMRVGIKNELVGPQSSFLALQSQRLTLAIDGIRSADYSLYGNAGLEYAYNELAFLRVGYFLGHDTAELGVGAGLMFRLGRLGLKTDYAYVDYGVLKPIHQFSIALSY